MVRQAFLKTCQGFPILIDKTRAREHKGESLLKTGTIEHEVVYGLSSLSLQQAPAPRMLSVVRDHWAIENRLHWRRDVTLGEDACQTRTGSPPSLLAQLNSTVLSLMDRIGVRNVPRQMRYFDAHPEQALALVLTGSCFVY